MLTWVLISLFAGLIFWTTRKPSSLPPGRWGLPVIGYVPLYTRNIFTIVNHFRKQYGDIFTWKIGGRVIVCLCDYKLIKTTFSRTECQGRADLYTFDIFKYHSNSGLVNAVGDVWSEGRRFTLRHLRDFGLGKSTMEDIIQHEAVILAKSYENTVGTPVELTWNLNVAALNVIWKLVANQRYEIDDEEVIRFNKMFSEDIELVQGPAALLDLFPGLHEILPTFIQNRWMKIDLLHRNADEYKDFVMNIIRRHEETLDPKNPRDLMDAVLIEMKNQRGKPDALYKEDYINMITSVADLFLAGSETTSSTTRWMVALMANYPEIQKKMQREIDSIVPRERPPSLQDRDKLIYTEAVLLEVHRFASLVPLGVFHATTEAIKIEDYVIPKNTLLCASAEICHRDPKYWKKPSEFYPEHFLDDEGKLLTKKEGFLPFSLGRRQCLGESLARMELFLFATCLFQKFFIAPPKAGTVLVESDRKMPLFNFVPPYKVVMKKRE